jgi:hypothetical protein
MASKRRLRSSQDGAGDLFDAVRIAGLALDGVESAVKYDGSPVLRVEGRFMAGLATHESAEAGTLVVRVTSDDRAALLDEAPHAYYITDQYRRHPVVLVRLSAIDDGALRDLLRMSRRLTMLKGRRSRLRAIR